MSIQGLYEVCIGIPEEESAIKYWQQFGYSVGLRGELAINH